MKRKKGETRMKCKEVKTNWKKRKERKCRKRKKAERP